MAVRQKTAQTTRNRRRTAAQKARDAHSTTRPATPQADMARRHTPEHIAKNKSFAGTQRQLVNLGPNGRGPNADQHDGSLHDPIYWNGKVVEYVRDIGTGDPQYDGNLRQVLILDDGKPRAIPESEILREGPVAPPPLMANRLPKRPL